MSRPKFSIVIPTRERHGTLKHTIETCLAQDYDDYEVVVSDNFSSDATRQVVEGFASPRIVYKRTALPLCMRDNWNTAYELSQGDWITFVGDDDGMMPFGLRQLDNALRRHNVKAARWDHALYTWPDIIEPRFANYMNLCLRREEVVLGSRKVIKDVLSGSAHPTLLPNVYHGAVSRDVLEKIRTSSGSVFVGYHPDTYTSFGVAYFCDRHLSMSLPLSIAGFSGASNNIAFTFGRWKNQVASLLRRDNAAVDLRIHPWVPDLPIHHSVIYDSFLHAKRDLFADDADLVADRKAISERILRELPIDDVSDWPDAVAEIRRSLSDDAGLVTWFDALIASVTPTARPRDELRPKVMGFHDYNSFLHVDTAKCGAFNVADAARLADGILNLTPDMVPKMMAAPAPRKRAVLSRLGRRLRGAVGGAGARQRLA